MKIKLGILLVALGLLGCAVAPPPESGVKKIFIQPFTNETVQYSLHTDLLQGLQQEFLRDSYLNLVPENEAEYKLSGIVVNYELRPMSYNIANLVESYEMVVAVKVKLEDLLEATTVFDEVFDTSEIYFTKDGNPLETLSNTELEQETQKQAINTLVRDITRKVVYAK